MIPNTTLSSYSTYDGGEDYTLQDGRMAGLSRGKDTLIGWMTVALTTERGAYPIFSQGFGLPRNGDADELSHAVKTLLLRDERIRAVPKAEITKERGTVSAHITVSSVYGPCETDVTLNV